MKVTSLNYEDKTEKNVFEEILRTKATCNKSSIEMFVFYFAIGLYLNDSKRWTYQHQTEVGI